ncbi:MAG: ATP-binding cassette domain-containing protein [Chloroflexi bacterium]|nr:ATP-binding cassette domain-containing protein [Chloroflexota bacterium]
MAVALMGPSGSGKTTLLSILGMLTIPTAGTVLLDGQPPLRARGRTRLRAELFSWVFQGVNVLPRRSAVDNAALGLLARGMRYSQSMGTALAALEVVGLHGLADRRIDTLSGGEVQRVCIARALATRPRYILADEPTGQLDRANTAVAIDALVGRRPRGTAVVIATHDPFVAGHCDVVVQLVDGTPTVDSRLP